MIVSMLVAGKKVLSMVEEVNLSFGAGEGHGYFYADDDGDYDDDGNRS